MSRAHPVLWSMVLLFLLAVDGRAAEPRRVLMLHAFNYTFPATTAIAEAARKRLLERSSQKIEIDAEFLDLARNKDPAHDLRTVTFLRDKYAQRPPDLVMTLGSAALPFVMMHRDEIAPNVPVVFTSVSPQTYAAVRPPPQVTGIISEFNLDRTLELAERLQPEASRLFVIAGSGDTDRRWQAIARTTLENRERKFEVTYLFELPYAKLVREVSEIPRDAIVIILTVFADGDGTAFVPAEAATALSAVSPAPVYAPYDTFLGNGTVGGFVEPFESVGVAAADMAIEIMEGKDPTALAPRTNPGQYRVDYRAMERWNLREDTLPPGTTVLFKSPRIWDEHRGTVLSALFIFGLQSLFVSALLIQRRKRLRVENLLKESEERMTFAAAAANIGLWQFDRNTDEFWASEHCRTLFGILPGMPLTRQAFLAAVHPDDLEIATLALRGSSFKAKQAEISDVRILLPGDEVRWVRMRARYYAEQGGESHQLGGIFIDVTDRKSAEAEATLQRQEVEHLMRVSVLGELSGSIAHEINQPLTAILSNAQAALHLMAQKAPDLAEVRDALEEIVHEDNRAGEVIQRLRSLLRKGERKAESVKLNDLINSTVGLLNSELIRRDVNVKLELADNLPMTSADPIQLQQVLLNLVMNAMDAMASTPMTKRSVLISTRGRPTGSVEVLVKDRGHGIPLLANGHLFEPFYTTKQHGLGLGLTICSTIIQAHGGKLTLVNDQNDGAIAAFSVPALETTAVVM
ncbi:MAG: ABC transporter substrate binding protein [Rhizomicrobium sp.]